MGTWEAIIYGVLGGACELLPVSFVGHAKVLRSAFDLWPLGAGEAVLVRAAICLGAALAIFLAMGQELRPYGREFLYLTGLRRRRRGQKPDVAAARGLGLGLFALLPALLSLIFLSRGESISKLPHIALFFALNGLLLYFGCRQPEGTRGEREATLPMVFSMGLIRMAGVLPGLSGLGGSLALGNLFGLRSRVNLRLSYGMALVYELVAFVYFFIRGLGLSGLSGRVLLLMLVAFLAALVMGYLALSYLRYLQARGKMTVFAFYCWEAAALVLILALINA